MQAKLREERDDWRRSMEQSLQQSLQEGLQKAQAARLEDSSSRHQADSGFISAGSTSPRTFQQLPSQQLPSLQQMPSQQEGTDAEAVSRGSNQLNQPSQQDVFQES